MFRWDRGTFSGEIRALRPLSAGEEVTISYFQGIGSLVQLCMNVKCSSLSAITSNASVQCPVCGRPSKERDHNDEERSIIATSMTDIGKYYREIVRDWITDEINDRARLPNDLHAVEEVLEREMDGIQLPRNRRNVNGGDCGIDPNSRVMTSEPEFVRGTFIA